MTSATFAAYPDTAPRAGRIAAVRVWLAVMAALVFVMVLVGGATRLTDSGLAITEWRPFMGAIPPLNDAAWAAEFEKYRQISQYQLVNKGMSLADFQFIYWWEWGHRQFGRFIGFAWFLPLLWFAWKGVVRGRLFWTLAVIGALGGLQAGIGWLMVHSGLQAGMVAVAPIKLTMHLTLACIIFAAIIWMWSALEARAGDAGDVAARGGARLLLVLLFGQIALGGLVAGLDAGLAFNTWPLMDGAVMPSAATLFAQSPLIQNFAANIPLVQLNHRLGAYVLLIVALWHAVRLTRGWSGTDAARRAQVIAGLVLAQGALGVATLLLQVPLWAGLAHQGFAVVLLGFVVRHVERSRPQPVRWSGHAASA